MGIFINHIKKSKGIAAATTLATVPVGVDAKAQEYNDLPVEMNPEIQEQLENNVISGAAECMLRCLTKLLNFCRAAYKNRNKRVILYANAWGAKKYNQGCLQND